MKLSDEHLRSVLKMYGREFARLDFVASGYRNTSHIVETTNNLLCNLIVYKREPGIAERVERINQLSVHVRSAGLPVRVPLDARIMRLEGRSGAWFASLYSFEHGATIAWEMYSMKHIKLLGMAMGRFHGATRTYDGHLPSVTDEYRAIVARMERYFSDESVAVAMRQKLSVILPNSTQKLLGVLDLAEGLPSQQALHMDLVRGNTLFRSAEASDTLVVDRLALSGILDLEKAAHGSPLFDLARTYAFLLVDCNKPADKIWKYFFVSGYIKRGGGVASLLANEKVRVLFEQLVTLFLCYDFYKFLRQNPYESLQNNHHFVRTRDILHGRKVLYLV